MMKESTRSSTLETDNLRFYATCRVCGSREILKLASLAPTPPADHFLLPTDKSDSTQKFPLDVALCHSCGYVFLPWVLKPETLYPGFRYLTSTTVGLVDHYQEYIDWLNPLVDFGSKPFCLDIGSNDGSFLLAAKSHGARVLGIEPGKEISRNANLSIRTICGFFDESIMAQVHQNEGQPDLITANYVYANIEDIFEFTQLVAKSLAPDGVFVVQTGYHPKQMGRFMFDYIYHEHLSYFSVSVLKKLFEISGLELIGAHLNDMKGGSVRVVGQIAGARRPVNRVVGSICAQERKGKYDQESTYKKFTEDVIEKGSQLKRLLVDLHRKKKTIVGYGASHSTTTLMHCFDIGQYVDYLVDDNSLKQGRL